AVRLTGTRHSRDLHSFPTRRSSDLMKLGAVPVPVNTLMRAADYRFFLDDSRAKVAIVSEPLLLEAGPALVQAKHLKHVVVVGQRSEEHTSELQSRGHLVCRLLLEKK